MSQRIRRVFAALLIAGGAGAAVAPAITAGAPAAAAVTVTVTHGAHPADTWS